MGSSRRTVFPPQPPMSETDAASIRANDWAAFRELSQLMNHWTLEAWPPGRRSGFYWYLTFDDADLATSVKHCQDHLGAEGLDPVPLDGLHLTMLGIGDTDRLPTVHVEEIVERSRAALRDFGAFEIVIGPLGGSRSAIRFSVTPWDRLIALHRILRDSAREVTADRALRPTIDFRPHLGIGYCNTDRPASTVIDRVRELRALPPVTVSVGCVKLVELWPEEGRYCWRDHAVVALAPDPRVR
ncbi:2'-5' RNA ligase family protein [Nocardia sp. CNY236]|uniref:2'-5' RNA ligase family protein n=1 Tax=Nocardia sp. CNY236 TaxID=1169152 RepID=UPI000403BA40|nr:2'-5' RNA ligase family protein [Nocardia sp. CNY236]